MKSKEIIRTGHEMMEEQGYTYQEKKSKADETHWVKVDECGDVMVVQILHRVKEVGFMAYCEGTPCYTSPKTAMAVVQYLKDLGWEV
jgi:hypothetical protein